MKTPYCAECGRKVVVIPAPHRNKRSCHTAKNLKDHDLCRQCFKALMYRVQERG